MCFLRTPNSTLHYMQKFDLEKTRYLGLCSFLNVPKIQGIYTCGFNGHPNLTQQIDDISSSNEYVHRYYDVRLLTNDKQGRSMTETVIAGHSETVELLCRSAFDAVIESCAFIDPTGVVHIFHRNDIKLQDDNNVSKRLQYFGNGLHKGECGLQIIGIINEDFGQWTCNFQIAHSYRDETMSFEIWLIQRSKLSYFYEGYQLKL